MVEQNNDTTLSELVRQELTRHQALAFRDEVSRIHHLYSSAMQVASTQLTILDEEFTAAYDHSPIPHLECRVKKMGSIIDKLRRKGYEITAENFHRIQDIAGIRVICNYVDDIYYLRKLLIGNSGFQLVRERDYIQSPKANGYRSLHLIVNVPFMIAEGRMELPVEIQLRTIAMDMWASLEHELRYKSDRAFTEAECQELLECAETLARLDAKMQELYRGDHSDATT